MKKSIFLSAILLTAFVSSCKDDMFDNTVVNPVQTGDEILFGSTLSGNANTIEKTVGSRTVYGDRTDTGIPVYWESDGTDTISIFCLQTSAPDNHLVKYVVKPVEEDLNGDQIPDMHQASSVTKIDTEEAGLQWGNPDEEHRFYAFYPSRAVLGSEEENETGMITANIPQTQQVQEWRKGIYMGSDMNLQRKIIYYGLPNMDYAYMYAYYGVKPSDVEKGTPIDLHFKNLVTVLDITIQGPETGSVVVTNVNVNAIGDNANVILTGDFTCNIRNAKNEQTGADEITATCTPIESNTVRNRISIPCYAKQAGNGVEEGFITLNAGELLNVKAYIIPQDEENTVTKQTLQISVATLNGAPCVRTLAQADVEPHKVNRVLLPKLVSGGTNYWMNSLDPNIYASELSIPGSKMSVSTEQYSSNLYYQKKSVQEQFNDGIRAFILQTKLNWGNPMVVAGGKNVKTLEEALQEIKSCLDNAQQNEKGKREFAFVILTWDGLDIGIGIDKALWIRTIVSKINDWKDKFGIYPTEIDNNTTLGDLAGKMVIKVNYNDTDMGNEIASNANYPILFSEWTGAFMNNLPLKWGSSHQDKASKLLWFAQECTACGSRSSSHGTIDEKIEGITNIFNLGVTNYKNDNEHKIWMMNDLGGYYDDSRSDQSRVTELTSYMNDLGIEQLQSRTENAGLGLVFMNFADKQSDSGALYKSDWLIQTIIDNNFKFELRKSTDQTRSRTEYVTRLGSYGWDE